MRNLPLAATLTLLLSYFSKENIFQYYIISYNRQFIGHKQTWENELYLWSLSWVQFTQNITKRGLIQTQLACSSLKNVTTRTKRPVNNYICSISFNKYYFSWMFNEFGFFSILIFFKLWKNYFDTKILCCSNIKYFFL